MAATGRIPAEAIQDAIDMNYRGALEIYVRNGAATSVVECGNMELFRAMLSAGLKLHSGGAVLLAAALTSCKEAMFYVLLESGAGLTAVEAQSLASCGSTFELNSGAGRLIAALKSREEAMSRYLLKPGARLTAVEAESGEKWEGIDGFFRAASPSSIELFCRALGPHLALLRRDLFGVIATRLEGGSNQVDMRAVFELVLRRGEATLVLGRNLGSLGRLVTGGFVEFARMILSKYPSRLPGDQNDFDLSLFWWLAEGDTKEFVELFQRKGATLVHVRGADRISTRFVVEAIREDCSLEFLFWLLGQIPREEISAEGSSARAAVKAYCGCLADGFL
jgi:hypothetical protein